MRLVTHLRLTLYRRRHLLAAGLSVSLFAVALWMLHRELAQVHLSDLRRAFGLVPVNAVWLSVLSTCGSYLALTGYDVLALRHIGKPLPYARVALTSFIATAVGHNLGMALLSAGMIRLRMYTASGLSAAEVTGVAALIGLTFGIGVTFSSGLAMLLDAGEAALLLHLSAAGARILGTGLLMSVGVYLLVSLLQRGPVKLRNWRIRLPGIGIALGQLMLAGADLACAAGAIYWLLPAQSSLSFPLFLGVYVLAVVAGILSHVPGGLGVFETVLLLALPNEPRHGLLAAILAYRAIYFLLPLAFAALLAVLSLLREQCKTQSCESER